MGRSIRRSLKRSVDAPANKFPPPLTDVGGSSSGFGRALVDAARGRGERVVATARRPELLSDLEADDVLVLGLDVTREAAIEPALDAAVERFGRVDVLVNNAGVGFVGALEEASLADLREVMETMFSGPAALARAVVPRMRAQAAGPTWPDAPLLCA